MNNREKNILSINLGNFGSTGKIMIGIGENAEKNAGYKSYYAFPGSKNNINYKNSIVICSEPHKKVAEKLAYYTGYRGIWMEIATLELLKKIDKIQPSIIHLHNLHDTYINLPMLFNYIKKNNIHVVWTLHDCWAFTGQCTHFVLAKCDKWKSGCYECNIYRNYPASIKDKTKLMWKLKKEWFTGVKQMTLVTPSYWLAELVKQSFLRDYEVKVINNGININIFSPRKSDFREKYKIKKYMVLGVAFDWGFKKGLDVFIKLAECLPNEYKIVLVGTNDEIDEQLPDNIISIHRTHNQMELAEIYTAADVFVNPSREENYPTVNMEAIACGTPVITFNTGGSPEIIDRDTGIVVESNDVVGMKNAIELACEKKMFSVESCLRKAKTFNQDEKFLEYIRIYEG